MHLFNLFTYSVFGLSTQFALIMPCSTKTRAPLRPAASQQGLTVRICVVVFMPGTMGVWGQDRMTGTKILLSFMLFKQLQLIVTVLSARLVEVIRGHFLQGDLGVIFFLFCLYSISNLRGNKSYSTLISQSQFPLLFSSISVYAGRI